MRTERRDAVLIFWFVCCMASVTLGIAYLASQIGRPMWLLVVLSVCIGGMVATARFVYSWLGVQ